jgi:hypothetical protein
MADGTKKPKGWLIAALICFLLAIAGCGVSGYGCTQVASLIDDVADTVPLGQESSFVAASDGTALVGLSTGAVCEGTDDAGGTVNFENWGDSTNTTVNEFNTFYTFEVKENATYAVVCGSESDSGTYTIVKLPSFLASGGGIAAIFGGVAAGGLFLLLAIIFLIVGLVRRSSWKKRQMGGGLPPVAGGQPYGSVPPPPGGATGAIAPPMGAPPMGAPGTVPPAPGQAPGAPPAPPMQPPGGAPPPPPAQPPGGAPPPPPMQPPGGAPPPPPPSLG